MHTSYIVDLFICLAIIGERAKPGVYKFELVQYMYMYEYGGTCTIIVAHAMLRNVGKVKPQPFFIMCQP